MNSQQTQKQIGDYADQNYKYGFETLIESERSEKGLNEDTIKFISAKKKEPQWMLDWRLKSFAKWKTMQDPSWANIDFPKIYVFASNTMSLNRSLESCDGRFTVLSRV